jgi:thiamine-phosphate diphosphorylase
MLPPLHVVTDDSVLADAGFAARAGAVLAACGPDVALHLRGHGSSAARLHGLALELAAAALETGGWLLVNDRVDIAMSVRANGVQLGRDALSVSDARLLLGRGARIGYSAHSPGECGQAAADGADFVLAGTIWASASHPHRPPAGVAVLRECAARCPRPVLAIGGVTPERVAVAVAAGARGVAVLGGVWDAADAGRAALDYRAALKAAGLGGRAEEQEQ